MNTSFLWLKRISFENKTYKNSIAVLWTWIHMFDCSPINLFSVVLYMRSPELISGRTCLLQLHFNNLHSSSSITKNKSHLLFKIHEIDVFWHVWCCKSLQFVIGYLFIQVFSLTFVLYTINIFVPDFPVICYYIKI